MWTRRIVRDLIRQQFDVEMTPQGVGKLLHRLGLSPQRPLYRAYQQNPEAVQRWKQEEFPEIREQARKEGAEVYFGDESGVRTDHHAGTTWAPVGQTPVVEVTGERKSVNMISAVSPGGTLHFEVFFGSCNATVFVEFLKKLMHDAPGPVYLILDNVSFHKASSAGSNLTDMGRCAARDRDRFGGAGQLRSRLLVRWGGHGEGLRRSRGDAVGVKVGASLIDRFHGERGNRPWSPSPPGIRPGGGQVRCRLVAVGGAEAP